MNQDFVYSLMKYIRSSVNEGKVPNPNDDSTTIVKKLMEDEISSDPKVGQIPSPEQASNPDQTPAPEDNKHQEYQEALKSEFGIDVDSYTPQLEGAEVRKPYDYPLDELIKGIQVEQEHTKDNMVAMEIAMDHLAERADYYTVLLAEVEPKIEEKPVEVNNIQKQNEEDFMVTEAKINGVKDYYVNFNVGTVKYVVNFHNGESVHKDGSKFYDMRTFKNKVDFETFLKKLQSQGYKERTVGNEGRIPNSNDTAETIVKSLLESFVEGQDVSIKDSDLRSGLEYAGQSGKVEDVPESGNYIGVRMNSDHRLRYFFPEDVIGGTEDQVEPVNQEKEEDVIPDEDMERRNEIESQSGVNSTMEAKVSEAYVVTKDGKELKKFEKESEAFGFIQKHQGQSVDYATKHGGYKIVKESINEAEVQISAEELLAKVKSPENERMYKIVVDRLKSYKQNGEMSRDRVINMLINLVTPIAHLLYVEKTEQVSESNLPYEAVVAQVVNMLADEIMGGVREAKEDKKSEKALESLEESYFDHPTKDHPEAWDVILNGKVNSTVFLKRGLSHAEVYSKYGNKAYPGEKWSVVRSSRKDFKKTGVRESKDEKVNEANFIPGTRVRVGINSGIDSEKTGVVVDRREVQTDGRGVATNIEGHYKPVDWSREVAVKLDNGPLITMFKDRLELLGGVKEAKEDKKSRKVEEEVPSKGDQPTGEDQPKGAKKDLAKSLELQSQDKKVAELCKKDLELSKEVKEQEKEDKKENQKEELEEGTRSDDFQEGWLAAEQGIEPDANKMNLPGFMMGFNAQKASKSEDNMIGKEDKTPRGRKEAKGKESYEPDKTYVTKKSVKEGTEPGKFEQEPAYVEYFWGQGLEGISDADQDGYYMFTIESQDAEQFPELVNEVGKTLILWEDENGFVYSELTEQSIEQLMADLGRGAEDRESFDEMVEACDKMDEKGKKWEAIRGNMTKKQQSKMAKKAARTRKKNESYEGVKVGGSDLDKEYYKLEDRLNVLKSEEKSGKDVKNEIMQLLKQMKELNLKRTGGK
jgi:hypothetical protein